MSAKTKRITITSYYADRKTTALAEVLRDGSLAITTAQLRAIKSRLRLAAGDAPCYVKADPTDPSVMVYNRSGHAVAAI